MTAVLTINTYAGSLILGARAAGAEVIGSLEDAGFGVAHQRLNFPDIEVVPSLPWPDLDLTGVWVLAHPPCSAFSRQNKVKSRQGESTDAFGCHRRVMDYAMGSGCEGLAIESVVGAASALPTYRATAARYGYEVSVVYLNAVSFGVPQWRPRLWVLFRRRGFERVATEAPTDYRGVGEVLLQSGTEMRNRYAEHDAACLPAGLLDGRYGSGSSVKILRRMFPDEKADDRLRNRGFGGRFDCSLPRVLDEKMPTSVILTDSIWYARGRQLFLEEYCAIMGFPTDYKWPKPHMARMFLSKGVCPPVATWVLNTLVFGRAEEVNDLRPRHADVIKACATRHSSNS